MSPEPNKHCDTGDRGPVLSEQGLSRAHGRVLSKAGADVSWCGTSPFRHVHTETHKDTHQHTHAEARMADTHAGCTCCLDEADRWTAVSPGWHGRCFLRNPESVRHCP